jgi:hypothetical protein
LEQKETNKPPARASATEKVILGEGLPPKKSDKNPRASLEANRMLKDKSVTPDKVAKQIFETPSKDTVKKNTERREASNSRGKKLESRPLPLAVLDAKHLVPQKMTEEALEVKLAETQLELEK